MIGMLGRKVGMTQLFRKDGRCVPITVLEVGPVVVVQVKTKQKEGYDALQVGYQPIKKQKLIKRPLKGHFKQLPPMRYLKEYPVADISKAQPGQSWDVRVFNEGEYVRVSGISKGRGFQGVLKRHGFAGGPASHGSRFHRTPGSIGNHTFPGRVFKGKRLPGHMGNKRISVHNLWVEKVAPEKNLLLLRGAVPGANGGIVEIFKYTLEDIPPVAGPGVESPQPKAQPPAEETAAAAQKAAPSSDTPQAESAADQPAKNQPAKKQAAKKQAAKKQAAKK